MLRKESCKCTPCYILHYVHHHICHHPCQNIVQAKARGKLCRKQESLPIGRLTSIVLRIHFTHRTGKGKHLHCAPAEHSKPPRIVTLAIFIIWLIVGLVIFVILVILVVLVVLVIALVIIAFVVGLGTLKSTHRSSQEEDKLSIVTKTRLQWFLRPVLPPYEFLGQHVCGCVCLPVYNKVMLVLKHCFGTMILLPCNHINLPAPSKGCQMVPKGFQFTSP